ncbi:adenylate/guanylate cyclase domain-containing protein [Aliiglaciecola sp. LCG003]|uniref:adenylate/guanylate cyclase domain-containing protein n=1 Tax=Aliiglaciecola sp. LCG003 TaxID=3053655 RepID=UPI002573E7C3|nr:adenylate/guanylate cyclase domain-containing protein [Aliiglaciecola sp. LCG003]WJG10894.1 adenylate/guanylate cyclase domain-containing protein [Aliiglaciecola sp. LCG003]
MFKKWFKYIAFLGVDTNHLDDISPLKIINILVLMINVLLIAQLPLIGWFWQYSGIWVLLNSCIHIPLFFSVLLLNKYGHFLSGRALFMLAYISLISVSSLAWKTNLHFHFFFLVALFVSPFLYQAWEYRQVRINLFIYFCCYCGLEFYWLNRLQKNNGVTIEETILTLGNTLFLFLAALISCTLVHQNHRLAYSRATHHKAKIHQVLFKTLPERIINKLLDSSHKVNTSIPAQYHFGSVLFIDIVDYTQFCHNTDKQKLIKVLDTLYQNFDTLALQHGLEKIKTNGDQYMAVCGVLEAQACPSITCCRGAMALLASVQKTNQQLNIQLEVRVGIATGTLICGIVGRNSYAFDVWGDTVNRAARIESNGQIDRIQVCQSTYELSNHLLAFEPKTKINAKGLGTIDVYVLSA